MKISFCNINIKITKIYLCNVLKNYIMRTNFYFINCTLSKLQSLISMENEKIK